MTKAKIKSETKGWKKWSDTIKNNREYLLMVAPGALLVIIFAYLPLSSWVRDFSIGIDKGCNMEKGAERRNKKKILFYGSSVTYGSCASRPGLVYPALLGRMLDCEITYTMRHGRFILYEE